MSLSTKTWHERFQQQSIWTSDLRGYFFEKAELGKSAKIIEVGCGTGAVLSEIKLQNHGLDIDFRRLQFARSITPNSTLVCGDAHNLPYRSKYFNISFCHFLLLWVNDPKKVLDELIRITKPGGSIFNIKI